MIMVSKVMMPRNEGGARLGLWLTGLVFVVGVHVAVGMLLCHGVEAPMPDVPPLAAVTIDLPPAPLAPSAALSAPVVAVPPAAPVTHAAVLPAPALPAPALPAPALPASVAPPRKPVRPRPVVTHAVAPKPPVLTQQASAPISAPVLPPPVAASGPATSAPAAPVASAVPNWQSALLGRLQRAKRYPQSARDRSEQGVANVTFTMDRSGHVLSVVLARGSGSASLDEEAVAMIQRADPLPSPPPEIGGDTVTLTVPVRFFLTEAGAHRP